MAKSKITPLRKRKRSRQYTGILQYFHNFEHSPQGLNHCKSNGQFPYTIKHHNGKHIISSRLAKGHGRGGKPRMFRFTKREAGGYNMTSGVKSD